MRIAGMPDVVARLKPFGVDAVGNSTGRFTRHMAAEIARWATSPEPANIKIEQ